MERTNDVSEPFVKDECYYEKCRLCTFPSGNTCTDIYSEREPRRLAEQIKICTGIEVSKDDGLPQRLCSRCYIMLRLFYPFVLEAQQAQFTLTYWEYISQNLPLPEGVDYPKGYKGYEDECNHHCKKIDDNFRINKNDDEKATLPSKSVATERENVTKVALSSEISESKSKTDNEIEAAILSSKKRDSSDSKKSKPKLRTSSITKRTVRMKTPKKWKPGKLKLTKYRNTTLFKESNVSNIQSSAGGTSLEKTCKLYGGKIQSKHNNTPVHQPSSSSSTQLKDSLKSQLTENNLEVTSSPVELNDSFVKGKDISHQEEKHSETHCGNATQCGQIISSKLSVNGPLSLTEHKAGDTSSSSVECVSEMKEVNNVEDKKSDKHLNIICTDHDENVVQKSAHNSTSDMILPFKSAADDREKSEEQDQSSYKQDKKFTAVDEGHLYSVSRVTEDNTSNEQIDSTSESFLLSGASSKDYLKPKMQESSSIDSKSFSKCDVDTRDANKQDECDMDASCHLSIHHPVTSEIACVDKSSTLIDVEPSSRSRHEHLMEHQAEKEEICSESNVSQKSKVVRRTEISCRHGDKDLIESSMNDDQPVSTGKTNGKKLPEPISIDLKDDSFSAEDVLVKHIIFKPVIKDGESHLQESAVLSSINSGFDLKFSSNTDTWMDEVMKGNSSKSFPEENTASIKPDGMCDTSSSLPDKSDEVVNISQIENGGIKSTVISTKLISEDSLSSSINQTNSEAKTAIACEEDRCYNLISRETAAERDVKDQLTSGKRAAEHVKESSSCSKVVISSPPGTRRLRRRKIPERYRSDSFLKSDVAPLVAVETQSRMKNKLDKQNDCRLTRSVKKGKVVKSLGVQIKKKVKLFNKDKCGLVVEAFYMENKPQEEMKATIELSSNLPLKSHTPDKENVSCTSVHDDKASKDQLLIKPVVVDLVNDIEGHNNTGDISKIEKNVIGTSQSLIVPTDKEVKILTDDDEVKILTDDDDEVKILTDDDDVKILTDDEVKILNDDGISLVQLGTSTNAPIVEMSESVTASVDDKYQVKEYKAENRSTDIKESGYENSCQKLLLEECQKKDGKLENRSTDIKESENENSCQKLLSDDTCYEKDDKAESRCTYIKTNESCISSQKLQPENKCQEKDNKAEGRSIDIKEGENENSCRKSAISPTMSTTACIPPATIFISPISLKAKNKTKGKKKSVSFDFPEESLKSNDHEFVSKQESLIQSIISPGKSKERSKQKSVRFNTIPEVMLDSSEETSGNSLSVCENGESSEAKHPASRRSILKSSDCDASSLKSKSVRFNIIPEVILDSSEETLGNSLSVCENGESSEAKHPASRRSILKSSDCDASFLKLSPDKLNKPNILDETNSSYDTQKAMDNISVILPVDGGKLSRASRICRLVMSPRKSLTKSPLSGGTLQDKSNTTCDETMPKEQCSSPSRKLDVSPSISESSSPSSDGTYKRIDSTSPPMEGRLSRAIRILQLATSPVQEPENKVSAECTENGVQDKSTNKEDSLDNTKELLVKSETSESNKCTNVTNSGNLLAMTEVDVASLSGANSSSSSTPPNEVSKQESLIQSIILTGKSKERSKRKSVRFNIIPEVMLDSSEETSGNSLSFCENGESSDVQNLEGEAEVRNECKSLPNSDPIADSKLKGTHTEEESNNTSEISKLPTKVSEGSYSRASRICSLVISPLSRKNIDASSVRRERDNSPLQKLSPVTGNSQSTRASRIFNLVCPNKDDGKTGHVNASPKLDTRISAVPPSHDVSNETTRSIDDQNRLSVLTCKIMDSGMMRTPPVARRSLKRKLLDESNLTPDKEAKIFVQNSNPAVMWTSSSEIDEVKEASRIHPTREINELAGSQLLFGKEHTPTCPVMREVCDESSQETLDSDSIIRDSECEERVSGNKIAHVHMNGLSNEDQLSCENYSATCTQDDDLKTLVNPAHIKSSESLPSVLKCELCGNRFHSTQRLGQHMKRLHGKDIKPSNKTVK